jgi:2-oxo-3-hexenedioate decarboxylase
VRIADCAADNGLHGRLVLGSQRPIAGIPGLAEMLPRAQVELFHGQASIDRGVGENVLGSPLLALGHLVELLRRQPEAPPLAAGEVVTTGVLTDAHPVSAGETWRTAFEGLPLDGMTVTFS